MIAVMECLLLKCTRQSNFRLTSLNIYCKLIRRLTMASNSNSEATARMTTSFIDLPSEIRNAIYGLVLASPSPFFIVAAEGIRPGFRLRERSDRSQYEVLYTLQALSTVSRDIRHEVRTFFYASKKMIILPCGYEYLPIFVHWLNAIGRDCRAVLRTVCFAGYMWYRQSTFLTDQFHELLRTCVSLCTLVVQINIWHLSEICVRDLYAYLNFEGPEPHDGPIPDVDMSGWADTVVHLIELEEFRLDFVMSIDKTKEAFRKEIRYMPFATERGRVLAEDAERRLRGRVSEMNTVSNVAVAVRYVGTSERVYHGRLW